MTYKTNVTEMTEMTDIDDPEEDSLLEDEEESEQERQDFIRWMVLFVILIFCIIFVSISLRYPAQLVRPIGTGTTSVSVAPPRLEVTEARDVQSSWEQIVAI